jgi:galactonate dehydratase
LWDIKGKYFNAPIYQLLGGACRDSIRVYSWIGRDRPSDVGLAALEKKKAGFTAIKMNATEELQYIDSFEKIDPVLSENIEALRDIASHTTIPIATGERMYSRWDFKKVLNEGYVDIIQPDLSHAGGITECKKISAMAEAYDVAVAPHCPLGPIALAACLQVDATAYNAFIQEQSLGIHYNQGNDMLDYITDTSVFAYKEGYVNIPQGPGLGIEINEEYVKKMAQEGHRWRNPIWRHKDGTVAEW